MGCWNGTCGISNLPILDGDKILLFPLMQTRISDSLGGGFCYATDRYEPVGVPIYGQYNDYGGIENITKNGEGMFKLLSSEDYKMNEEGLAKIPPADIEELLNDFIERGLYKNLSFMMVREDIIQGLKEFRSDKMISYRSQFAEFAKAYEEQSKKHAFKTEFDEAKLQVDIIELEELRDMLIEGSLSKSLPRHNVFSSLIRDYSFYSMKEFIMAAARSNNEEDRDAVIDVLFTQLALSDLRKFWTVQSGAGSQDQEIDLHVALSKTVISVAERIEKERIEYWGE